jgi:hypothetical protein
MDLGDSLSVVVVMGVLLLGPALAPAAEAQGDFSVSWEPHLIGGRDAAVKGYVDNRSQLRIGDVHLRVETLDAGGKVIGEAYGWVTGDARRRQPGLFRRPCRACLAPPIASPSSRTTRSRPLPRGEIAPAAPAASPPMSPRIGRDAAGQRQASTETVFW